MKDVAIIGVSGRFPEAANLEAFRRNLVEGRDSVRDLSADRKSNTSLAPDKEYKSIAFLDDVDKFDHKFFQISKTEAENMDPHQRIILEVVYETLENSGYDIDHFNGTETAVFIGDTDQEYYKLADRFDPTLLTGNTSATTAGRISRFFNFRGIATMVDTACSSSLVAVHMACNELDSGSAELAIACGVRFILFPEEKKVHLDLGIMSNDGKTKSFSDKADGSGAGEAAGCVLLKPLDQAIADNDHIYAVIKGTAANQDAQLSGSLTAPSSQAQSEVLRKAWKRAGIDPKTIGYIETHGSGTKLGDPIEIGGINQAFKTETDKKQGCTISALKSNIGHTGGAAGISGLIKAILALKNGEHYPSLHFDVPNPFIDFENSAVAVNTVYRKWEQPSPEPRRAGVSSFGLSGTNCHVVLEESPTRKEPEPGAKNRVFTFSAKSETALKSCIERFSVFLADNPSVSLADASYTLTTGRKNYSYRSAVIVQTVPELLDELKHIADTNQRTPVKKLLFLFPDDTVITESFCQQLKVNYPTFGKHFDACSQGRVLTEQTRRFAFQYSFYRLLETLGITTEHLLGIGAGDLVVSALLEEMTVAEALQEADHTLPVDHTDLDKRLMKLIDRETETGKVAFIEIGPAGILSKTLSTLHIPDKEELYTVLALDLLRPVEELARALYLEQYPVDWHAFQLPDMGKRIPLPTYPFEKTRCWLKEPVTAENQSPERPVETEPEISLTDAHFDPSTIRHLIDPEWTPTEQKIAAAWIEVLKLDQLTLTDDFFLLGGHSLMATRVIARIEQEFGLKLVFKDIFTFATVKSLAAGVDDLLRSGVGGNFQRAIAPVEQRETYPLSHAQKRLWLIHEMDGRANLAYNLPAALRIKGDLKKDKVESAFSMLAQRHESLRTVFEEKDGEPVQRILPKATVVIEELSGSEAGLETLLQQFLRSFELEKAPLLRIAIVQLAEEDHLLLFDMHHIISDGVSLGVLSAEFIALYRGQELPALDIQYTDYAVWQQEQFANGNMQTQSTYWLEQFAHPVPELPLPWDRPRSATPDFAGDQLQFALNQELTVALKYLSQQTGTTLYMVLLAAYNVLLHKYTHSTDIVVGSPIAGRPHRELESLIGMFVNTLAMRNAPSGEKTFTGFLEEVKENCLKAYENQDYPFELILENRESETALFNTLFVLQNLPQTKMELDGLTFTPQAFTTKTSQFDWTLEINENQDELLVNLFYSTALFDRDTMLLLQERWLKLLSSIVADPTQQIGQLSMNVQAENSDAIELDFGFNF